MEWITTYLLDITSGGVVMSWPLVVAVVYNWWTQLKANSIKIKQFFSKGKNKNA